MNVGFIKLDFRTVLVFYVLNRINGNSRRINCSLRNRVFDSDRRCGNNIVSCGATVSKICGNAVFANVYKLVCLGVLSCSGVVYLVGISNGYIAPGVKVAVSDMMLEDLCGGHVVTLVVNNAGVVEIEITAYVKRRNGKGRLEGSGIVVFTVYRSRYSVGAYVYSVDVGVLND